ncbi:MAG: hypothetical protein HQ534_01450 [Armatimonadetes bacterium]|nr:hypothetical protein [Armatimonadota bacterium]
MSLKTIKLYKGDGTFIVDVTPDGEGNFSHDLDQGAGNRNVKAKALDDAGNLSGFSPTKNYYPGCSNVPVISLEDETGNEGSGQTNTNTPQIKISIELPLPTGASEVHADSVPALYLEYRPASTGDFTVVGDLTDIQRESSTKFFKLFTCPELSEGQNFFQAKWKDAAGGLSAFCSLFQVIVDTSVPDAPTINLSDGIVYVGQTVTISGTSSD